MAAWCWTTINNTAQAVIGCYTSGSSALNYFNIVCNAAGVVAANTADGTTSSTASTSTSYPTSAWFHAAGVFDITSGTDRAAFLNGGGKGTQTTNRTPSGINRTSIGLRDDASAAIPFGAAGTGYIAMPAIWNTNLTDAEIALLAAGIPPWCVRPGNLVACWPMLNNVEAGNENNWWPGDYTMVEQGTLPAGPHNPPVVLPFPWMQAGAIVDIAAAPANSVGVGLTRSTKLGRVRLAA